MQAEIKVNSLNYFHSDVISSISPPDTAIRNEYVFGIVGNDRCNGYCERASPGSVLFTIGAETVGFLWITTSTTISLNTWTSIMVKRTSGVYSLYINGISQIINIDQGVDSNVIGNAALPVIIGLNFDGQIRNLFVNSILIGETYNNNYYISITIISYL